MTGAAVAAAARALIGSRFRLHGRDPATGLDCVGLIGCALGRAVPTGYALRGGIVAEAVGALDACLMRAADGERVGDVLLLRTGPAQLHLAIRSATGLIHADAGLRRVVEQPGAAPWPVIGTWRTGED